MIQMAEARGLFGRPEGTPKAKPAGQTARAKAALLALQARSEMMEEKNTSKVKVSGKTNVIIIDIKQAFRKRGFGYLLM